MVENAKGNEKEDVLYSSCPCHTRCINRCVPRPASKPLHPVGSAAAPSLAFHSYTAPGKQSRGRQTPLWDWCTSCWKISSGCTADGSSPKPAALLCSEQKRTVSEQSPGFSGLFRSDQSCLFHPPPCPFMLHSPSVAPPKHHIPRTPTDQTYECATDFHKLIRYLWNQTVSVTVLLTELKIPIERRSCLMFEWSTVGIWDTG